jgi:hypothetical protein
MALSSTGSSSTFLDWAREKIAREYKEKRLDCEKILNSEKQPFGFYHIAEVLHDGEFADYVRGRAARGAKIVEPWHAVEPLARRGHLEAMRALMEVYPPAGWSVHFLKYNYPSALQSAGSYGRLEMFDFLVGLLADAPTSSPEVRVALDSESWEPAPVPGRWLTKIGMAFLVGPGYFGEGDISAELHDRYLNFRLPWDPESGFPAPFEPAHLKTIRFRIGTAFVSDLEWRVRWESTARLLREGPALPLDLLVEKYESAEQSFKRNHPESYKYPFGIFQAIQAAVVKSLEALGPAESVDAGLIVRAAAIVNVSEDDLPGVRP